MKRRIVDDSGSPSAQASAAPAGSPAIALSSTVEKHVLPAGLYLYRYRLTAYPPNVAEHDRLSYFLGALISKLMVATRARMQPFICIDGRHLDDEFFGKLRESGATWRPVLGFPMIPGVHPFRYLPIAYQISNRGAWDEVAEQFLGTGGAGIYLSSLAADEFFIRLIQLVFTRNNEGATDLLRVFLPEAVLNHLEKAAGPPLERFLQCVQVFIGERPSLASVDIVSANDIDEVVKMVLDVKSPESTA